MNKKEAIAYAQIALNFLKNPNNNMEVTLENLENEMYSAFEIYPKRHAIYIAKNMRDIETEFD